MYGNVPPYIDGNPTRLNAVVHWWQPTSGGIIDVTETLRLTRHKTVSAWYGNIDSTPWTIHVGVVDPLLEIKYHTIKVTVRLDGTYVDSITFKHFQPKDQLRWDTGNLGGEFPSRALFMTVRIMG